MKAQLAAAAVIAAALTGCSSTTTSAPATQEVSTPSPTFTIPEPERKPAQEVPLPTQAPRDPKLDWTVSQRQAVAKAESYLEFMAFSRVGLIKQLKYEKFSEADATFAVDHIKVDWNEQAAKKAQSYLDTQAFSREGLLNQLDYEGFTPEEATHGVNSVGL